MKDLRGTNFKCKNKSDVGIVSEDNNFHKLGRFWHKLGLIQSEQESVYKIE
jgi:hypothetical protein